MRYQRFINLNFFSLFVLSLFVFSSSRAQVSNDDLIDLANRAYQLNEYENAWKSYLKLKQNGVESINGESIDHRIDLCEEILTLTSYAEARVLYRQRNFDEAIKVMEKDYCKWMSEVDAFRHLCETAKKEITKPNPRFIFSDKAKSELQVLGAILFGDRDPAISSAVIYGEPLAPYWDESKNQGGYINIYNNKIYSADYSVVTPFHEGLALVRKGNDWHYINTNNEIAIHNVGQIVSEGGHGLDGPLRDIDKGIYFPSEDIDELGWGDNAGFKIGEFKTVSSCYPFSRIKLAFFSNKLAFLYSIKNGGGLRIINNKGKDIFRAREAGYTYIPVGGFFNGYAIVESYHNGGCDYRGMIDAKGQIIIPCEYYYLTNYGSGLIGFQKAKENPVTRKPEGTGGCGYMNLKKKISIPPRYQDVLAFHEGLAAVKLNDKWGYIDSLDNVIIPFVFDEAYDFGHLKDGFAHVKLENKDGFIDHFGFSTLDDILYESDNVSSEQKRINNEIHNTCPFIITDIQFSAEVNGYSEIRDRIKGDSVTYIWPIISYHGIINTECDLDVKWYTPDYNLETGRGSTSGFSYSSTNIIERGDYKMTLSGWGNNNPGTWSQKGEYVMELWYKGRLLKTKTLYIY